MKKFKYDLYPVVEEISKNHDWINIRQIKKGWSNDKKYQVVDNSGNVFLLRISPFSELERRKAEYKLINSLTGLKIPIPRAVKFGLCGEKKFVYMVITWVSGNDATKELPVLSKREQYNLGLQAGKILQAIHLKKQPMENEIWTERYTKKIHRIIDKYMNCPKKLSYGQKIIDFLTSNIYLLNDRDTTLQHGDYHIGSFVIDQNQQLGVIDFNRSGIGDPWEEYDRFVFTWSLSSAFAVGQVNAYFNGGVPDNFFKLMSLYNAANMLASIPWAIPFGNREIKKMIDNCDLVYNSYNGFTTYIPNWYDRKLQF
ncbi:MAG: hypothetical protein APR63_13330 [Desulfuromonas sp. SDB]|nr:MAG: hypothetical protein APR63_13330 [Desulfuromonas sp. SDB]